MRRFKRYFPSNVMIMFCLSVSLLLSACFTESHSTSPGIPSSPPTQTQTPPPKTPAPTPTPTPTPPSPTPPSTTPTTPATDTADLVPYSGPVQHIFFHPLIAYPELAFSPKNTQLQGYNDWFVTVSEFDKILDSLYQKNFILIDIHALFDVKEENGQKVLVQKQLMLPKNKKPLILSVDDMNYYDYMRQDGNVYKLILDADGNVATYSVTPQGQPLVSHDNEIVPILDSFVQKHPDFSFQGAKGMINLTGYQGILGYRTNDLNAPDYAQEKQQAMQVVARLKATGWTFASHGYGHLDDANISYSRFVSDTERWQQEVEPLIGPTDVYVYPFGSRVPTGGDKFQFLLKSGFDVLCSVGPTTYVQWTSNALMMDRRHIDGISLHSQRSYLLDLFDSNDVIDKDRPPTY